MKKILPYQNGHCLSYADYGTPNGFPVLTMHGMVASINNEHLFDKLAQAGARLISIARPGYGDSSPYLMQNIGEWGEIVACLVEALGLAQFDVLGISSGAPYGYAIAHRLPDRVRRLFILSGIPALYDDRVVAHWPYPVSKGASMAEMQQLAWNLFFAQVPQAALENDDFRDSMLHNCFGPAQDLRIRGMDWGFRLEDLRTRVIMRHSRSDESFAAAQVTASLLPDCTFEVRENDPHFSQEVLDDFIDRIIAPE